MIEAVLLSVIGLICLFAVFVVFGPIRWYNKQIARLAHGKEPLPEPKWLIAANKICIDWWHLRKGD